MPIRLARSLAVCAVAIMGPGVALALAGAATGQTDIGLRYDTAWPEPQPLVRLAELAALPAIHERGARRIWAASGARPLRITLGVGGTGSVRGRTDAEPQVVFPKLPGRPAPPRPTLVTIYQDRTLRDGDAVMMADGIHVFRGTGRSLHRPSDFVRLTFAAALDWHLRQSLDVLDRNPPTRWTALGSASG